MASKRSSVIFSERQRNLALRIALLADVPFVSIAKHRTKRQQDLQRKEARPILHQSIHGPMYCAKPSVSRRETMIVLKTEGLKKYYGKGESLVKALNGVDISIEQGTMTAIVGTSGSGKSTLLNMLGGLDRPTEGTVTISGTDISTLKDEALTIFRRRKIGFVFQAFNLVPVLNVYENIVLPIELDGNQVDNKYIDIIIKILGLESKQHSMPSQLSGGQQQRVAIARALATKPAIILADEPTGNLDSKTSQDVLSLLKVTGQKLRQTIVMITHNEAIAQMADRIIRIEDGKIYKRGEQNV